ncbi:AMP-binding protein [Planktosalinus lacus]|uniref:AMP-binding protein n=1 Tax=Planktosalinus lacus TaxID=1526573 RepID=A0A8J2VBC8_9FLAO|nr:AMP-binding protein [Planktosalinus lacus]
MYNYKAYKIRYGGSYKVFREEKEKNRTLSLEELKRYQAERFKKLIEFAKQNSAYYQKTLCNIPNASDIQNIQNLPILDKETLRQNIESVVVQTEEKLEKSKTGGTTGKSLEVQNFAHNSQERFAFLDDFRSRFGYELRKKTAWFSGKNLLTSRDIKNNRFWKTDFIHKVRYYSTFHINEDYLKYYVEDLIKYKPQYLVGFPSTMLEIAKYGLLNGYDFPADTVKAVFPTAETITLEMRARIERFFKTKLYDQYASSEGAPFIFECKNNKLHLELQSGVFEVLDENNHPTQSGRLVVTSFTNEGTPLIRYDIGDSITLEDESVTCTCSNNNPLVKEILGRVDDYIYSPENGKINIINVANAVKDVEGVIKYQILQNKLNRIDLIIVKDENIYNTNQESKFIQNWKDRLGNKMELKIKYVDDIPVEKSGKFRMVKNNIKHLIN